MDAAEKSVQLRDGELEYDYLIVATGASHAYFGHDELAPAPGFKSWRMRSRFGGAFWSRSSGRAGNRASDGH